MSRNRSGPWVTWDDYAALAAENERLKAKLSMREAIAEICSQPPGEGAVTVKASLSTGKTVLPDLFQVDELKAENERLKKEKHEMTFQINCDDALIAENERLRKAGDAMMEVLESEIPFTAMNAVNGWLAAKEGGAK